MVGPARTATVVRVASDMNSVNGLTRVHRRPAMPEAARLPKLWIVGEKTRPSWCRGVMAPIAAASTPER